jgi:hypothetical protein
MLRRRCIYRINTTRSKKCSANAIVWMSWNKHEICRNSQNELQKHGHIVRLNYTGRRETLKKIEVVVLSEELLRRKHLDNSTMDNTERDTYIAQWKEEHRDLLLEQLGPKDVNVSFFRWDLLYAFIFSGHCAPVAAPHDGWRVSPQLWQVHAAFMLWNHGKCQHAPGGIRDHLWK